MNSYSLSLIERKKERTKDQSGTVINKRSIVDDVDFVDDDQDFNLNVKSSMFLHNNERIDVSISSIDPSAGSPTETLLRLLLPLNINIQ